MEDNMNLTIDCEQESDGRWLAEIPQLPGVMVYAESATRAISKVQALALRVIAERLEHEEIQPLNIKISVPAMA
ncbi:hypothetical protein RugamoR57_01570 [Duganella caerulea]